MISIFRVLIGIPFFCVGFVAGELWAFLRAGFIEGRDS
jgi:hypothetical protein